MIETQLLPPCSHTDCLAPGSAGPGKSTALIRVTGNLPSNAAEPPPAPPRPPPIQRVGECIYRHVVCRAAGAGRWGPDVRAEAGGVPAHGPTGGSDAGAAVGAEEELLVRARGVTV